MLAGDMHDAVHDLYETCEIDLDGDERDRWNAALVAHLAERLGHAGAIEFLRRAREAIPRRVHAMA